MFFFSAGSHLGKRGTQADAHKRAENASLAEAEQRECA
jgi:hypothetical protein